MGSDEHSARRVVSHERAEDTHLRAAGVHDAAERQAHEAGDEERARHEHQLAADQRAAAALEHERARRARDPASDD